MNEETRKKLKELLELYKERKIKRVQIRQELELSKSQLKNYLHHHNIKIWDYEKKITDSKLFEEDARHYGRGEMTFKDLAKKHNLSIGSVKNKLYQLGYETAKPKTLKKNNSKYYNWRREKDNYSRFFYEFNK